MRLLSTGTITCLALIIPCLSSHAINHAYSLGGVVMGLQAIPTVSSQKLPYFLHLSTLHGLPGYGCYRLARLSRYILLWREPRESVAKCGLGMDIPLLVAGFNLLLIPLILLSRYTPSWPIKLLYLCIVLFPASPRH